MIPRGTGWDFARSLGLPRKTDRAIEVALSGKTRTIDLGRANYRLWAGGEGESFSRTSASAGMSGAIAQRANDTSKAFGGKVSYLWATFAVFARWSNSEVEVSVDGETRQAPDARRHRGQRPLHRRRDEDRTRCRARRRHLRRAADRRHLETRSGADDAEDLPRHASSPPEGRTAARRASERGCSRSRSRSSSTANSPARRPRASRSSRRRCGFASPASVAPLRAAALARGGGALGRGGLARGSTTLALELVEPLLDRAETLLELLEPTHAPLQLVDALRQRPERGRAPCPLRVRRRSAGSLPRLLRSAVPRCSSVWA